MSNMLNVNVGVLGHVDSGKTSLGVWVDTDNCSHWDVLQDLS